MRNEEKLNVVMKDLLKFFVIRGEGDDGFVVIISNLVEL